MTRREWSELAAAISAIREKWGEEDVEAHLAIKQVVYGIANVLSRNHARFDSDRFLTECGLKV